MFYRASQSRSRYKACRFSVFSPIYDPDMLLDLDKVHSIALSKAKQDIYLLSCTSAYYMHYSINTISCTIRIPG